MKRLISAVLVLLALGAAAFFFLKMRRYLPERSRAAELAPAETVLFMQFPNLRQTALRFPKTNLYQIWREPAVQVFLEKPRLKAPWMSAWEKRFAEIAKVAPGEVFVAFTSVAGPRPSFVGGFSFAGHQRHAEALAGHLREQFIPGDEIVSAVWTNWYLFATDADLLARMIERFEAPPGAALAADPVFQKSIAPLGTGQDLVFYGKPEALSGRLGVFSGLGGKSGAHLPLAMGTKLEGENLHDTIFLPGNGAEKRNALSRQTLPLASGEALLYYVTDLALLPSAPESGMLAALLPGFARMERSLAEKGLSWNDLPSAVGSEVGAMIEWPKDAAMPTLLLASETRDLAKARSFAEALIGPANSAWRAEGHAGIALLNAPSQAFSFIRPALAVTDRFALFGLSPEAIESALPRAASGGAALAQTAAFQELAPSIPPEAAAFGYLDFPRLFERVYRMTRPFITLSLAFSAEAGAQWDAGKLPPVESISKHLGPSVIAQTQTADGMVIESIGSLTVPELLFAVSAGGIATGLPDLSGALSGGAKRPPRSPPKTPPKSRVDPAAGPPATAAPNHSPEKTAAEHK